MVSCNSNIHFTYLIPCSCRVVPCLSCDASRAGTLPSHYQTGASAAGTFQGHLGDTDDVTCTPVHLTCARLCPYIGQKYQRQSRGLGWNIILDIVP
ncbi:hypothetical protein DPMN_056616 [Dreissena polymorpha]|uniref:Uncharacterized protein n=1 Tax=Dreissena polymorpha TaxID=45954 RepID=A0A9D4CUQ3_DREPO|nr:hypothetical protein DPMN_056616 [Dreissena polymorpha]